MTELDDITIARAKKDNKAFKKVYDYYAPYVWKIAFRTMHGNHDAAQEAMQETFIRVHNSLLKFSGQSAFSTWIYRIVFNVCLTMQTKQKKSLIHEEYNDEIGNAKNQNDAMDMREDVERILASLDKEERFLLAGRELLDLSYAELAHITQKNEGSLRTQLSRIKEDIRRNFKG